MKWYQLSIEQVEKHLQVNPSLGLTRKQVDARQKQYGRNEVKSDQKVSKWLLFFKQFQDFMVLILLAATLIAGLLGEYIDAIAIIVIVIVNGILGFFQENRAEKSLEKLKELSAPLANVLRDGEWVRIPSKDVVVGDVVRITSGDRIPADLRIIKSSSMETEESTLTGESLPVKKHATEIVADGLDAQDQANMAFMGTLVTRGSGLGIVVQTGIKTMMGQIADLMSQTRKMMTPLEHKLAQLGKILIGVVLILTAMVMVTGIFHGHPVYQMFLAGVSLAVAAIPEGLPAIVTVALSLGVQRMIKRKAIVRKLSAVETLGCTSVICSDKTGTITENEMTVKQIFLNNSLIHVHGDGYAMEGDFYKGNEQIDDDPDLAKMLLYGNLCNQASLSIKKGKYLVNGDPTDGAILIAARKYGIPYNKVDEFQIIKEIPFDSNRKRMSVVVEDKYKQRFLISKGAPEVIVPRSMYYMDHGQPSLLKDSLKIEQAVDAMAKKALRTIAIAIRPLKKDESLNEMLLEKELTLIGVFGMLDPPRKEVKQAIHDCRKAGIKTVMITGDHVNTAEAVAREINLLPENGRIVQGHELNQMSVQDLSEIINDVYVFARVTPEHKLKIVKAFQDKGHVVAMTGDGVNDAPAIKASDIGIGMGQTGTDVTKEAASLILLDDNFSTIKEAIKEGRNIYENIRKFIRYLLASNVGEILVMLFAMLLALPLPLMPIQILWVNLVTDGLPAMALGLDQPEKDAMKRPPRHPKEGIFARGLGMKILSRGFLIGVVTLIAFIVTYQNNPDHLIYAQTVAFATIVLAQLIHVFDCRNEDTVFDRNPFQNIYLIVAVLSSLALLLVVIYWAPLQPIFYTTHLNIHDWLLIIGLSAIPTVLFGYKRKK